MHFLSNLVSSHHQHLQSSFDKLFRMNQDQDTLYLASMIGLVCLALRHINPCRSPNTKSIFMSTICSTENSSVQHKYTVQLSKTSPLQTTQAVTCNNAVKCKYSFNVEKQFSQAQARSSSASTVQLSKTFPFQAIQFTQFILA